VHTLEYTLNCMREPGEQRSLPFSLLCRFLEVSKPHHFFPIVFSDQSFLALQVPLLEHFEGTVVLFCSFRKDAIDAFDEVSFFNHVNMIYAIFDEIVEKY
jgi:hypothetical protein